MRVLVFLNYYLPAYKAGGPLRTIQGMVDYLGDDIDFSIVTSDRDSGDAEPFSGITTQTWVSLGESRVCYVTDPSLQKLSCVLEEQPWDILYLQSFFNWRFTIRPLLWRKFGRLKANRVLLATRGEFSQGAISIKPLRKRLFLWFSKVLRIYKDVYWQVSSKHERDDLLREIPALAPPERILIAADVPPKSELVEEPKAVSQSADSQPLRVVFLSRISEKKNLGYAIEILSQVKAPVEFSIVGPADEGSEYWKQCQRQLSSLPENIVWNFLGSVTPQEVPTIFSGHDLFLFPTRGENFGHVIFESLLAGCPVLLSDQTPWLDLEQAGVGWVVPLADENKYCQIVETIAAEHSDATQKRRKDCVQYAREFVQKSGVIEDNLAMFDALASAK